MSSRRLCRDLLAIDEMHSSDLDQSRFYELESRPLSNESVDRGIQARRLKPRRHSAAVYLAAPPSIVRHIPLTNRASSEAR